MAKFLNRMRGFGFGKGFAAKRSQGEMADTSRKVVEAHTPPDVTSARAKSMRHRKSTADKWNQ